MRPPIEKIWEMGKTRRDVLQSKYSPKVGDAPEPLTDYMDVSDTAVINGCRALLCFIMQFDN